MKYEFRWIVPDTTYVGSPILQVRTAVSEPHWGEWQRVPMEVVTHAEFAKAVKERYNEVREQL